MTYQELVSKLKDTYQEKDASKISEHLAIQFNIQGEAEGALYLEIANGQLHIEPYEYYDRDILVTTSAADLLALAQGSLDILEVSTGADSAGDGASDEPVTISFNSNAFARFPSAEIFPLW